MDLQGVQALHSNHAVDAVYIHLRPASKEDWAHAQSLRQVLDFGVCPTA